MNKYSITGLKVASFDDKYDVNRFLERYDGDIFDVQYRCVVVGQHVKEKWMIVYVDRE